MTQNEIEQKFKAKKLDLEVAKNKEKKSLNEFYEKQIFGLHEEYLLAIQDFKKNEDELKRELVGLKIKLAEDKLKLNPADYAKKEILFLKDKNEIETEISKNSLYHRLQVEKFAFEKKKLNDKKNQELNDINLTYSIKLQELKDKMFKEIEENRKSFGETE